MLKCMYIFVEKKMYDVRLKVLFTNFLEFFTNLMTTSQTIVQKRIIHLLKNINTLNVSKVEELG